jgi:hypothetical protein
MVHLKRHGEKSLDRHIHQDDDYHAIEPAGLTILFSTSAEPDFRFPPGAAP